MAESLTPSPGVSALQGTPPQLHVVPKGSGLLRIWFSGSRYPSGPAVFRYYGPTTSRFDHHLPGPGGSPTASDRGILYVVEQDSNALTTAIAEVFQEDRRINLVPDGPVVSTIKTSRDMTLLDTTGFWATKAGASASLFAGSRADAQGWSRNFYNAYPHVDGIRYRSSMSGGIGIAQALYERSEDAFSGSMLHSLSLSDPVIRNQVYDAADSLGYSISLT